MPARLSAFVIWALVAGSAVFWALRLLVSAPQAPAQTVAVSMGSVLRGDLSRLLGAPPSAAPAATVAAPDVAGRFKLVGVMAPKPDRTASGQGIALIAVDGKPARPFRVGAAVDGDLVLQAVSQRGAAIGPREAEPAVRLELPPLPAAATGTLPRADSVLTPARPASPAAVVAPPPPAPPASSALPPAAAAPPAGSIPATAR